MKPSGKLTGDPSTPSAVAKSPPPGSPGHSPTSLLRAAYQTRVRAIAAWPGGRGLPSSWTAPTALLGFPSLRRFAPAGGWTPPDESDGFAIGLAPDESGGLTDRRRRHLCRSGPTCRSRRSSAPIDFRRGDRPHRGKNQICARGVRPGMRWRRLLGFAPVCGPRPQRTFDCGPILPWALPLAGLAGALLRIRPGTSPVAGSPVPEARAAAVVRRHDLLSAHGFAANLPVPAMASFDATRSCPRAPAVPTSCLHERGLRFTRSPSLQRLDETDAWPVRPVDLRGRSDRLPV